VVVVCVFVFGVFVCVFCACVVCVFIVCAVLCVYVVCLWLIAPFLSSCSVNGLFSPTNAKLLPQIPNNTPCFYAALP